MRISQHGIALITAHVAQRSADGGAQPDAIAAIAFVAVVTGGGGFRHMGRHHGMIGRKAAAGQHQRRAANGFARAVGPFHHDAGHGQSIGDDLDQPRLQQDINPALGQFRVQELHHVGPAMTGPAVQALARVAIGSTKTRIQGKGITDLAGQPVHTGAGPISNGARDHRIRLPAGFRHDVGKHGIGIIGYAHGRLRLRAGRAHQPLRHGSGAGGAGILFDQQHRGPRRPRRQRRHRAGGTATNHDDRHAIFELWPLRRLWITLDHPSPLAGNRRARNCGFAACAASAPPHAEISAQRTVWRAAAGACNAPDYGLQVMWP